MTMTNTPLTSPQSPTSQSQDEQISNRHDVNNDENIIEESSPVSTYLKLGLSALLLFSSISNIVSIFQLSSSSSSSSSNNNDGISTTSSIHSWRRRLSEISPNKDIIGAVPSYMDDVMSDLTSRQKLMEETPPEEVKYWFEYTGPLQKYYYRYSKSRGKADSFDGRDDSGVVSSRFHSPGGGSHFSNFFHPTQTIPTSETNDHLRLLDNCFAMGSSSRPNLASDGLWYQFFGSKETSTNGEKKDTVMDRCRVLVTLNTVGAGKGPTILWETNPPLPHANSPEPWISEQETAATHLKRNLEELNSMCATGMIAIRLQVLVCEPIPGKWTDWMDSMLSDCGGRVAPFMEESNADSRQKEEEEVEDRPSPVQVVVVASASTADTCHDLKSGFMEKRLQDLILAPPFVSKDDSLKIENFDPEIKTTHPDLVSSDPHDLYIAMKWTSLVSIRSVSAFLQASADIAAAAASPRNQNEDAEEDGVTLPLYNAPSSPFLIPSFVRVSYVSEENNKVAKWRMHGDFFHPAAWEICKDSFDMTWIPDSLSGNGGVNGICYSDVTNNGISATQRRLEEGEECGQWWIFMAEEQMPTSPEIYANEAVAPIVQGGSNFFWMVTERQRQEIVKQKVCDYNANGNDEEMKKCGQLPQAIMPLGDMESFLINFTPNTALGKKHNVGRRPGYSREKEREQDRELVRERKQLKGQEDIEKALFDYTVYPAALFRKDATLKAARLRDAILTKNTELEHSLGPQTVKSSYYDVTITKPRDPVSGWCQNIARNGLCALYAVYFRESPDTRCLEACGMKKNWTKLSS
jgi:hypothetical protein